MLQALDNTVIYVGSYALYLSVLIGTYVGVDVTTRDDGYDVSDAQKIAIAVLMGARGIITGFVWAKTSPFRKVRLAARATRPGVRGLVAR